MATHFSRSGNRIDKCRCDIRLQIEKDKSEFLVSVIEDDYGDTWEKCVCNRCGAVWIEIGAEFLSSSLV